MTWLFDTVGPLLPNLRIRAPDESRLPKEKIEALGKRVYND